MVPYPTVLRHIDLLSDAKYDTVPEQPPPSVPTKQSQKTKAELKQKPSASTASTGGVTASTSSSGTSLHEVPPPDDPLEEQNIWCEMLLLEGRKRIRLQRDLSGGWTRTLTRVFTPKINF